MTTATPKISTSSYVFPPSLPSAPTFGLQVTELADTYLLWLGIVPSSLADSARSTAQVASDPLRDDEGGGGSPPVDAGQGAGETARLGRDWAVGMPGRGNLPPVGTPLLRSTGEDLALPLAQRLARRFKKQVYLSVDVGEFGQGIGGAEGARVMLDVERGLVGVLSSLEKPRVTGS